MRAAISKKPLIVVSAIMLLINAYLGHAEPSQERIALMLSGDDCPSLRQTIGEKLLHVTGVVHVDFGILPDHVMIDQVHNALAAEHFPTIVKELVPAAKQCRPEVMKSCITADFASHHSSKLQ